MSAKPLEFIKTTTSNIVNPSSTASISTAATNALQFQSPPFTKCPVPESNSAVIVVAALGWTLFLLTLALAFVLLARLVRESQRSSRGIRGSQARSRANMEPGPTAHVHVSRKGSMKRGARNGTLSNGETRSEGNSPERQHETFPPIGLGIGPDFIFAAERENFELNLNTGARGNQSVADGTNKQNRYAFDQRAQPYPSSQTTGINTGQTNPMNDDDGVYSVPKPKPAAAAMIVHGTAAGKQDDDYENAKSLQNSMAKSTSKSKPLPSLPPNECAGAPAVEAGGSRVSTSIVITNAYSGPEANNREGEGDEVAEVHAVLVQVPPVPAKPANKQESDYENFQRSDAAAAKEGNGISRKSSFKKLVQIFQH